MLYSSTENQKIKDIKKIYTKKYRDLNDEFIVEGEHLVIEAYKNNLLKELIVLENTSFKLDVPTIYVTEKVMKFLSELDSLPKIMGICKKINNKNIGNKVLVLDGIQDPGNLGTIIRSSLAFNMDTIILGKNCVSLYNSKVIRATQGMLFSINIIEGNALEIVKDLKSMNYQILSTKVDGGKDIRNITVNNKFALIMGSEGLGVSRKLFDLSDEYIYIKMNEKCESLNVGVATSIILYELDK